MDDRHAILREVGLRDGLQAVPAIMPTAVKRAWIDAEAAAGVGEIEVASFVPPQLMPQFADAPEVVAHARTLAGLRVATLVPNLRGAERAFAAGVDRVVFVMSVSATHNLRNLRRPREQSVEDFRQIVAARDQLPSGPRPLLCAGLSTAFGCSYEGRIAPAQSLRLAALLAEAGADEVLLADTVGYATPGEVGALFRNAARLVGAAVLAAHFHDTRGTGLANVVTALDAGVRRFDASLGGLGGCPYAPGATGNIVMEDLCYMLHGMGMDTGIDLAKLLGVRDVIAASVGADQLHGAVARAGLPRQG